MFCLYIVLPGKGQWGQGERKPDISYTVFALYLKTLMAAKSGLLLDKSNNCSCNGESVDIRKSKLRLQFFSKSWCIQHNYITIEVSGVRCAAPQQCSFLHQDIRISHMHSLGLNFLNLEAQFEDNHNSFVLDLPNEQADLALM